MLGGAESLANVSPDQINDIRNAIDGFDDASVKALMSSSKLSEEMRQEIADVLQLNTAEGALLNTTTGAATGFEKLGLAAKAAMSGLASFLATPAGMLAVAAVAVVVCNQIADSMETAREAAERSINEYKEAASELQSMQSEYDTTKSKIEELKAMGPLSLTEQAELDRLQKQNGILERRLKIQERLVDLEQEEARRAAAKALQSRDYEMPSNGEASPVVVGAETAAIATSLQAPSERGNIVEYTTEKQKELNKVYEQREALLERQAKLAKDGDIAPGGVDYGEFKSIESQLNALDSKELSLGKTISANLEEIQGMYDYLFDSSGNIIKGNESLVKSCDDLFDLVLSDGQKAADIEQAIATILSKAQFEGVKESLVKTATEDPLKEYYEEVEKLQSYGYKESDTKFGNIDTNNRAVLEWNDDNLARFKEQIMSWQEAGAEWDDVYNDFVGSYATVYGGMEEFGFNDESIPIAFSPILQLDGGKSELLSKDTVYKYISSLLDQVNDGGPLDVSKLLKLDKEGLDVEGRKIKGLIASVGDEAEKVGRVMHFTGKDGSIAEAKRNAPASTQEALANAIENTEGLSAALKGAGVSAEDLASYILDLAGSDLGDVAEQAAQIRDAFGTSRTWQTLQQFDEFLSGLDDEQLHKFYQYIKDNNLDISKWTMEDVKYNFEIAVKGADEATETIDGLKKEYTTLATSIKDVQSILSTQSTGKSISVDDLDKLADYAEALEYVNGAYRLNQDKVTELIEAKSEEQIALNNTQKALDQQEYLKNAAEIEKLRQSLEDMTDSEKDSADAVRASIDSYREKNDALADSITKCDLMNAALTEATDAYHNFINAQNATQTGEMFDGLLKAAKQIDDVLNNSESSEYLKVGNENYKAAVDFVLPDSIDKSDTTAVNKYLKSLSWLFEKDDKGNYTGLNLQGFVDRAVKAGLMEIDESGESYQIAGTKTMEDFAKGLGIGIPVVQSVFGELNEYMEEPFQFDVEYDNFIDAIYACEFSIQEVEKRIDELNKQKIDGIKVDKSELKEANEELDNLNKKKKELYSDARKNALGYYDTKSRLDAAKSDYRSKKNTLKMNKGGDTVKIEADVKDAKEKVKSLETDLAKFNEPTEVEITAVISDLEKKISQAKSDIEKLKDTSSYEYKHTSKGKRDDTIAKKEKQIKQWESEKAELSLHVNTDEADLKIKKINQEKIDDKQFNIRAKDHTRSVIRSVKSALNSLTDKTVTITTVKKTKTVGGSGSSSSSSSSSGRTGTSGGGTFASGNAKGIALASGTAGRFLGGKTLVGERGVEAVSIPHLGKWYTVGEQGAELIHLPADAIVFNHEQTEQLLSRGYIDSRGALMMQGEAYGDGKSSSVSGGKLSVKTVNKSGSSKSSSSKSSSKSSNKSSGKRSSSKNNSGKDKKKKSKSNSWSIDKLEKWLSKFFDWIEVKLDRLASKTESFLNNAETHVDRLSWKSAATDYRKAMSSTGEQIKANQQGAKKYAAQANKTLDQAIGKKVTVDKDGRKKIAFSKKDAEEIKAKVASGEIDISKYSEQMQQIIQEYQEYYEKSLDCSKNVSELLDQYNEYAEALYNLPLDKLNHRLEEIKKTEDLLDAQYDIATDSSSKNKILAKKNKQALKEKNANADAVTETASNLESTKKKINNSALKGLTSKQKDEITSRVKEGKLIDWSRFEKLTLADKEAIIAYNNALEANKEAVNNSKIAEAEYTKTLRENAVEMFNNIADDYSGVLNKISNASDKINAMIDQTVARGYKASSEYYSAMQQWEQENLDTLTGKRDALQKKLLEAVESGVIKEGTAEFYEMQEQIDDCDLSIIKANTSIIELGNSIRKLDWDKFDDFQTGMSKLNDEADFLVELLSMDDLFDENGNMTAAGEATQAMYAQKYNTYMRQADEYAKEIARLDEQIANDPNNVDLLERRQDLVEAQRESILAANDEKRALQDLAKDGIEAVLDKLKELIDSYTEALDSAKDLRDYEKDVSDKTSNISSLRKQLDAYSGDNSEETRKTVQQLKTDLVKAEKDLEDTQYDRYLSDTKELLDKVYDEYEKTLNERADDIDAVVRDAIKAANNNATDIKNTIDTECGEVGTTLSSAMTEIWGSDGIGGVLSNYSSTFSTAMTALNGTVNSIRDTVDKIYSHTDDDAGANTGTGEFSSDNTGGTKPETGAPPATVSSEASRKAAEDILMRYRQIKDGVAKLGNGIYAVKTKEGGWLQFSSEYLRDNVIAAHPIISSFINELGVMSKSDADKRTKALIDYAKKVAKSGTGGTSQTTSYSASVSIPKLAGGVLNLNDDELAWTQERGAESIVKPSANAILTPLSRGDSVLNAEATANLWKIANDPTQFLSEKLRAGAIGIDSLDSAGEQNINNTNYVTIDLPNVSNYEEFMNAARSDPKFEKLVQAMTTDRLAGRGAKVKNSIRW